MTRNQLKELWFTIPQKEKRKKNWCYWIAIKKMDYLPWIKF